MITRGKAKLHGLLDLPGMTELPGFTNQNATATLAPPPPKRNPQPELHPRTDPRPQAPADFLPVTLDADLPPAKPSKTGNRRVLRLSQESREILKLLKKNLHLTYDQQIQFLGQLVLHHELLPETTGLQLQQRVRELRRFSHESATQPSDQPNSRHAHLQLSRPLPLETLLAALEERCAHLQEQVETLTRAIDARSEIQLLGLELDQDYSDETQLPALN